MKSIIIKKLSALILTLVTILSVITISAVPASAASANISSNVKGISLKINQTQIVGTSGSIVVTPVLNSNAKVITNKIVVTIANKSYTLKANESKKITLPKDKDFDQYTLTVTFKFYIKVNTINSPKKSVYQTSISTKISEVVNISGVIAKMQKKYKNNKRYNISYAGAVECHGYACLLSNALFGEGKPRKTNKSFVYYEKPNVNIIKPGDLIRYRSSTYSDHSIIITKVDSKNVWFTDCNSDGKGVVRYNIKISKSDLQKLLNKKLLDKSITNYGYICHYKKNYL